MNIEWKRRLIILGAAAGVFVGYRYLLPVAAPFLAAWLLSEALYPTAVKMEKKFKIKRSIAGGILVTALFLAVGFLLYAGISELLAQIKTAVVNFPVFLSWCSALLDKCCLFFENTVGILQEDSRSYILKQGGALQEQFLSMLGPENLKKLFSGVTGLLLFISGTVVAYIGTILILADMENIRKKIWDYSWLVGVRRVAKRLKKTTVTYLKAQVIIMFLVAVVCGTGLWIMKNPYFLILGIALGALDALPLIGTGTFLYPAALVLLIRGNTFAAGGCVLLDIITSLLREFLEPRLLGGKLGVSPIAVLASVYIGVFVFGGWGVILGPLSFSTVYEIGKEWDVWD